MCICWLPFLLNPSDYSDPVLDKLRTLVYVAASYSMHAVNDRRSCTDLAVCYCLCSFFSDFDDHGDTVAFYLISLSRKDVIALGEALGLNANNLKKMKELPSMY